MIRKCIKCDNEAKIGSRYCKEHFDEMRRNDRITHQEYSPLTYEEPVKPLPQLIKYDGYNAGDFDLWKKVNAKKEQDRRHKEYQQKTNYHRNIKIVSKNGTVTKSKSECLICDFFTDHHIKFEYEKPFYYSEYSKPLKPDFYIKGPAFFKGRIIQNVYIEHFGGIEFSDPIERKRYLDTVKFKIPKYKQAGITLICTYEEDIQNYTKSLSEKLRNYKKNEINYLKES